LRKQYWQGAIIVPLLEEDLLIWVKDAVVLLLIQLPVWQAASYKFEACC